MSWIEDLREAAYTAPDGTRLTFFYEDVSKEIDKKTSQFLFPYKDGAKIQDLGVGSRRYPLRIIFWGDDYNTEANDFEDALEQKGVGILEHPLYGVKKVVPFGTISRRDDLKSANNQAIFDIAFYETIEDIVFPVSIVNIEQDILNDIDAFLDIQSQEFLNKTSIITAFEDVSIQADLNAGVLDLNKFLSDIAKVQSAINAEFQSITSAITSAITDVINKAQIIASQAIILAKTPARVAVSISKRIEGYSNIIASLTTKIFDPSTDSSSVNSYQTNNTFVNASLTGAVEASIFTEFTTKSGALEIADDLLLLYENVQTWQDANIQNLDIVDIGNSYAIVKEIITKAVSRLVKLSFTLQQERSLILDRNRTPIDLVGELYGDLNQLDFFITSNKLNGDKILEVKKGEKVLYYR